MSYQLRPGVILDGRYRIDKVIGHGGFGITYAGINEHIQTKVAIKELFIQEYMERDADSSQHVHLVEERYRDRVEKAKEDFLKEAIIIGIFHGSSSIVSVIDHFKANGTAYIIMDYIEGQTLSAYLKLHDPFEPEEIFRKMLPLMDTLKKIHDNEVIHRDISPDNLMLLEDGSLKLIDFGAARNFMQQGELSKVVKDGYAPVEQWNKDGIQGPWTDIYALSAVMYECITGRVPESSVQRMFYDELKKPSELGIKIDERLESILMKGLEIASEDRFQNLEEMETLIREVFPQEIVIPSSGKNLARSIAAGIGAAGVLLAVVAGYFGYQNYREAHRFDGMKIERVLLVPDEEMSAGEYLPAKKAVEERMEIVSGGSPWKVTQGDDGRLFLMSSLETYEGKEVGTAYSVWLSGRWEPSVGAWIKERDTFCRQMITPEDIVGVEIELGRLPDKMEEQIDQELPEQYYYAKITVSDACAKELRDTFGETGNLNMYYADDPKAFLNYGSIVYLTENADVMYVFSTDLQTEWCQNIFCYNMTHEGAFTPFHSYCEIPGEWEDPHNNLIAGKNQCSVDALVQSSVTIAYERSDSSLDNDELTMGEWVHLLADFKERLDSLGIPYAIGQETSNPRNILVRINEGDMNAFLAKSIMNSDDKIYLSNRWQNSYVNLHRGNVGMELKENGDGSYYLELNSEDEYDTARLTEFTKSSLDKGLSEIYIKFGDYYVVGCTITEPVADGVLRFDHFVNEERSPITDKNIDRVRYLLTCTKNSSMDVGNTNVMSYYPRKLVFMNEQKELVDRSYLEEDPYVCDYHYQSNCRLQEYDPEIILEDPNTRYDYPSAVLENQIVDPDHYIDVIEQIKGVMETSRLEEGWMDSYRIRIKDDVMNEAKISLYFNKSWEDTGAQYRLRIYLLGDEFMDESNTFLKMLRADEVLGKYIREDTVVMI